jgi:excisionase family DNA binding protein
MSRRPGFTLAGATGREQAEAAEKMTSEDPSSNPKMMKIAEVAEYLRVHRTTIYRLLRREAIPAFKIGDDRRFNLEEIDAWRLKLGGQVDTLVEDSSKARPK